MEYKKNNLSKWSVFLSVCLVNKIKIILEEITYLMYSIIHGFLIDFFMM